MGQIAGTVFLRRNGKLLVIGDATITCNPGHKKREAVMASDGPAGFISKPQTPSIEGELVHLRDLDVGNLFDIEDETITAELGNGQTFVLTNAWWASEGEVSSDGKIKFKFEGLKGEFVRG